MEFFGAVNSTANFAFMCPTAVVAPHAGRMARFSDAVCGSVCGRDAFADTPVYSLLLRENPTKQAVVRGEQPKLLAERGDKCVRFETVRSSFLLIPMLQ